MAMTDQERRQMLMERLDRLGLDCEQYTFDLNRKHAANADTVDLGDRDIVNVIDPADDLSAARGVCCGVGIGVMIWILLGLCVWAALKMGGVL